ncbi:MAG: Fe-S cluster assembly protein SufD [Sphingobacteriaceae bacterium]|nr:Fe-S cluster assembly protein SufD [Sphingobacteriaceae bacterium]
MLAEKINTTKVLTDYLTHTAGKVSFIKNSLITDALAKIEKSGLPNSKHEDYKYCNLEAFLLKEFTALNSKTESQPISIPKNKNHLNIVVVNGNYVRELSDQNTIKGLHITKFSELPESKINNIGTLADPNKDLFIALNTAYSGDGFYLEVDKNAIIKNVVKIWYIQTNQNQSAVNPRSFIELQEGSSIQIIEEHLNQGKEKVFTNYLSEKKLHSKAKLETVHIQDEKEKGFSVNTNEVHVHKQANYLNTTITISGNVVRNNHNVIMNGEFCETHLYGLFLTKNAQLVDNHTLMDHQVANCESFELYKGVVNDKSVGVFNGKIFVRKDAQKTNAYQSSKNILLSDDATLNTKPQLEIYADDVKCSHGTSTGKIDTEALFYLNARGINNDSANKLLLNAFALEVLEKISIENVKEELEERLGFN